MKTLLALLVSALLVVGGAPAGAAAPDTELEDTTWALRTIVKVSSGGAHADAWRTRGQELRIADGKVSFDTGCNRGFGPVEVLDDTLEFGALATTRIGCQGRTARIERLILKVLVAGAAWRIAGERLRISVAIGRFDYRLNYRAT